MSVDTLRNRWQQVSEPVVRRLQAEKLRRYLRRVVLPFSAHYRKLFQEHGLDAESIRSLADLQRVPFTSKSDLLGTAEQPQRFKDFILVPEENVLARRPETILRALIHGPPSVRPAFESEFRPI